MGDLPWLSIIGLGEDGLAGLSGASRDALEAAEIVMGPPRHLALIPATAAETIEWPVPFADGIPQLLAQRGRKVAMLTSGDPFWYGAGTTIARQLPADEWRAYPGPSTFSLAAARLGWPLEQTLCIGLHAAPLTRLRPHLAPGARIIALLRDGDAVANLITYLAQSGFAATQLTILEALGGPNERLTKLRADAMPDVTFSHPLAAALEVSHGPALPKSTGLNDTFFGNDGQMTKSPIRAMTLAALAPVMGETLWDIGGGSGSISIEWLLAHPTMQAISFEANAKRATRIAENARTLGVDRLGVVHGTAPEILGGHPAPDAIFVGGGLSGDLLDTLASIVPAKTRIVANAVTLESEAVLVVAQKRWGGTLTRIELSHAQAIGTRTGWARSYPIVQWSGQL